MSFDPDRDLRLERQLTATPEQVWRCWTEADLLRRFFAPRPWTTPEAVIDPRPGGRFMTRMAGPAGEDFTGEGCVLLAEPGRRFGWTDAMAAGYRPNAAPFMTAILAFHEAGGGTRYVAHVMHADTAARDRHAAMGFHEGWGSVAGQLDEVAHGL